MLSLELAAVAVELKKNLIELLLLFLCNLFIITLIIILL
jgi:hypothetical protein